jgi:hypothetical protein
MSASLWLVLFTGSCVEFKPSITPIYAQPKAFVYAYALCKAFDITPLHHFFCHFDASWIALFD